MLRILLSIIIVLFLLLFLFWRCVFLRDPDRIIPPGRVIVSPCDGKVVKVMHFNQKSLRVQKGVFGKIKTLAADVGTSGTLVSIFMSPLDVHVVRTPAAGKILNREHTPGKFLPVLELEAGLENEKVEFLMENKAIGTFKTILMAGFLARRIQPWAAVGQTKKKGERIGLINLGSQVTLLFNKKVRISVKEGERVQSGTSILGSY